jgi:hypothetical protein
MRRLSVFFALSIFLLATGCASTQSISRSELTRTQEVVSHPHPKDKAFNQARRWVAQNYGSADEVIQMSDKEAGTLVVKGVHSFTPAGMLTEVENFEYSLTLDIRDQKMRLTFDPIGWSTFPNLRAGDKETIHNHYRQTLKPSLLRYVRRDDSF